MQVSGHRRSDNHPPCRQQTPSATEIAKMEAKRKAGPRALLIAGIVLCTGPLWGFLVTLNGMIRSFNQISNSGTGLPPTVLAESVSLAAWATAAGLIVVPFGIAAVIAAIVWRRRIAKKEQEASTG
jgi:biopolymer transport protein ExbB/TolQ